MKKNIFFKGFPALFIIFFITIFFKCNDQAFSLINTSHLDFLYENILMEKDTVGIVHIYSDYPDYKWIGDDDEGIACVDDAARAALFYMRYYNLNSKKELYRNRSFSKAKNLVKFLIKMQSENGFFYNFIWPDHSINKTYKTSIAEPNWWTWRAIVTLSEAYTFFKKTDRIFSDKIKKSLDHAVEVTLKWLRINYDNKKVVQYGGLEFPAWLPYETAADQSAIILEGLTNYYHLKKDSLVLNQINKIAGGIIKMQKGDSLTVPYFAFLSWQNTWHAWGNVQSAALIKAGIILNNKNYIQSAIKEIKYFYPFLLKEKFYSSFTVEKINAKNQFIDKVKYSQIAYGISSMVSASLKAFKVTKDTSLLNIGVESAEWFFGNNSAGQAIYNPQNGICFDGINSKTELNKNSGAESTIETLLALISIEKNSISKEMLYNYYISKVE